MNPWCVKVAHQGLDLPAAAEVDRQGPVIVRAYQTDQLAEPELVERVVEHQPEQVTRTPVLVGAGHVDGGRITQVAADREAADNLTVAVQRERMVVARAEHPRHPVHHPVTGARCVDQNLNHALP